MEATNPRREFLGKALCASLAAFTVRGTSAKASENTGTPGAQRARTLDPQSLQDILVGCAYLGCGGGGSLAEGTAELAGALKEGLRFSLLSVDDLADEEWVASPYGIGSTAPPTESEAQKYAGLARPATNPVEASFRRLSAFLQRPFVAAIPGELGPWSTAAALVTSARLGIPTLDADRVGRATPEATQDSVPTAGLSTLPLAAVTGLGDALILESVAAGSRVEDLLRAISVASLGGVGVTDAALSGRDARRPGVLVCSLSSAPCRSRRISGGRTGRRAPPATTRSRQSSPQAMAFICSRARSSASRGKTRPDSSRARSSSKGATPAWEAGTAFAT